MGGTSGTIGTMVPGTTGTHTRVRTLHVRTYTVYVVRTSGTMVPMVRTYVPLHLSACISSRF